MDKQPESEQTIFRQEALAHHSAGAADRGDVLRLSPAWVGWTYRLLLAFAVVGLVYLCFGRMSDYAEGPAIVRASDRTDVTSPVSATVRAVQVIPGDRVQAGQPLVRLEDDDQQATVDRYRRELDVQFAYCLQNPLDEAARRSVASLRSQLEFARQRLQARTLVAPHDGVVSDVRTRPGQPLLPGQLAVTLVSAASELTLVAVLPGHFQPQLVSGQPARFEIAGYPHAYQPVSLIRIADGVVGPAEARRYLGQDVADAISIAGSVVLAEARLEQGGFVADGRKYVYADGLQGTILVRVRSVPIILNLLPGLRYIWEGGDHGFGK